MSCNPVEAPGFYDPSQSRTHLPSPLQPGGLWKSESPRIAILNCYSPILAQFHKMDLPSEVIEAMPPKRQTLFRGVWGHAPGGKANVFYSRENQAQ